MKLHRIQTTCSFLRRLSVAAAALLMSIGAAHAQATNYSATILADNPVAYYELQELPGATTAIDSTTNALNGTYTFNSVDSPTLGEPGIDTNSILFTFGTGGAGDYGYISLPASPLLAPVASDGTNGAPFSAECWVQPVTITNGDYMSVLSADGPYAGLYANNGTGWNFYQTQTTPPAPESWVVFMRTWSGVYGVGSGANIDLLAWTHLAITWDGTNATFYVNGQVNQTTVLNNYLAGQGANNIQIGGPGNTGHSAFEGGVCQVAFYTNVLTAAQILKHFTVGTNSISAPLAAPSFVSEPTLPATVYSGTPLTLTGLASGTAPLTYQWYSNNVAVPGQTNSAYSFVPVYPAANEASFYVSVTNKLGSTNSVTNVLTLLTGINVTAPPYSITREVGSHAAFRIAANGAVPQGYQWYASPDNGTTFDMLTNQTDDTLWLTNAQMGLSGYQYWVVVTNPFTSISNYATLTVQPRAVNVPLTGYAAIVAADNPVAFFRLDEPTNSTTATDAVGSFDGAYNNAQGPISWQYPTVIPGDTNLGVGLFDTNTVAGHGGVVNIPYALELNPYGTWSFEGWFKPTVQDPNNFHTVVSSMYNSNYSAALFGWLIYQHPASAWTLVTYNGSGAPATFSSDFGHIPLILGSWYHLAVVDDGTTVQLYVNGVAGSGSGAASAYVPNGINGDPTLGAQPAVLAQRSDGAYFGFNGGVDEVAFYNYALSPNQIMTHYLGKAVLSYAQANGKTILTWPVGSLLGSTNVAGPYQPVSGAASPYTVPFGDSQFFYVVGVPK